MTGPTETLVAQNLQDCKGYLVHTLNNVQFTHTTECNRKSEPSVQSHNRVQQKESSDTV